METTTRPRSRWTCPMPCAGFAFRRDGSVAGRIGIAGWGLFLLWVGAAVLLDVGWGIGLLGVGVLTLGMQVVRRGFGLESERFWLFVGGAITLAGLWELAAIDVPLGPVLLVALGMAAFGRALRR